MSSIKNNSRKKDSKNFDQWSYEFHKQIIVYTQTISYSSSNLRLGLACANSVTTSSVSICTSL